MKTKGEKTIKTKSKSKTSIEPTVEKVKIVKAKQLRLNEFLEKNPTLWEVTWAFLWRFFILGLALYLFIAIFITFVAVFITSSMQLIKY